MLQGEVTDLLNSSLALELMASDIPARIAYTGTDGAPRAVPVSFHWTGSRVVVCTVPRSYKIRALHADPRVALTIDTTGRQPPHVLLIRGTASIDIVDGVPPEYVQAARKAIDDAQWPAFETEVRSLYQQMARITITPQWAKLLDFETTLPSDLERLAREREREQLA
jgi:Pyridoxamine 5'-phosphate oxidase